MVRPLDHRDLAAVGMGQGQQALGQACEGNASLGQLFAAVGEEGREGRSAANRSRLYRSAGPYLSMKPAAVMKRGNGNLLVNRSSPRPASTIRRAVSYDSKKTLLSGAFMKAEYDKPWAADGNDRGDLRKFFVSLGINSLDRAEAVADQHDGRMAAVGEKVDPGGDVVPAVIDRFVSRPEAAAEHAEACAKDRIAAARC